MANNELSKNAQATIDRLRERMPTRTDDPNRKMFVTYSRSDCHLVTWDGLSILGICVIGRHTGRIKEVHSKPGCADTFVPLIREGFEMEPQAQKALDAWKPGERMCSKMFSDQIEERERIKAENAEKLKKMKGSTLNRGTALSGPRKKKGAKK